MSPPRDRKSTRLNSSHTVIYTLSLHDALPILQVLDVYEEDPEASVLIIRGAGRAFSAGYDLNEPAARSEEHTSELQSHRDLHSFPTRRSSDLAGAGRLRRGPRSQRADYPRRRARVFGWLRLE